MVQTNIINDNINTNNNSFLYYLHEKNNFNLDSFKQLIFEIIDLIKKNKGFSNDEYIKILNKLFKIYCYTSNKFIFQKSDSNFSKIDNYNEEMIYSYLPRLEYVIECLFNKDYDAIIDYEDELGNINEW